MSDVTTEPGAASGAGTGAIFALVHSGEAPSRAHLQRSTGLSRITVSRRVDALIARGLLVETPETVPTGGRPARVLRANTDFAVVLAADLGESRMRTAVTDLSPLIRATADAPVILSAGPEAVLSALADEFEARLREAGRSRSDVLGIGIGVPAPVDYRNGRIEGPSVMTGWDDFDIAGWMSRRMGAPVLVENDVNLLALAEHRSNWPGIDTFFFIKAGTGIGSGIIIDRRLFRGAQGAAGDIGHVQLHGEDPPLCRCGKSGCVEAFAAGWAIARDLRGLGFEARDARDVVAMIQQNRPEAIGLVRRAARVLGEVTADAVSILNPSVIVVGGALAAAGDHLLSGVREIVYQRNLPLATRQLAIEIRRPQETDGVAGAALLVLEERLKPEIVEGLVAGG